MLPADKYMWPPAPLVVEPTVNDIEPAAPAVATPVAIDTYPTEPDAVDNSMAPLPPELIDRPVAIVSAPVLPDDVVPVLSNRLPVPP